MTKALAVLALVLVVVLTLSVVVLPGVASVLSALVALPLAGIVRLSAVADAKGGFGARSKEASAASIATFFRGNVIFRLGHLLSAETGKVLPKGIKETIAHVLASGGSFDLGSSFEYGGKVVALASPLVLSLASIDLWACPACQSAHGSRVRSSGSSGADIPPSVAGLKSNIWYYSPVARRIFVVSSTCFDKYVEVEYGKRIRPWSEYASPKAKQEPAPAVAPAVS